MKHTIYLMMLICFFTACETVTPSQQQAILVVHDISSSFKRDAEGKAKERRYLMKYLMDNVDASSSIAHVQISATSGAKTNLHWVRFDSSALKRTLEQPNKTQSESAKKLEEANQEGIIRSEKTKMIKKTIDRVYPRTPYPVSNRTAILQLLNLVDGIAKKEFESVQILFLSDLICEGDYDMVRGAIYPYPTKEYAILQADKQFSRLADAGLIDSLSLRKVTRIEAVVPKNADTHKSVYLSFFYDHLFTLCGYQGNAMEWKKL